MMTLKTLRSYFAFLILGLVAPTASAIEEGIGTLQLSDVFLEPSFTYVESQGGEFQLGSSYLAVTWQRDDLISAVMKVGAKRLIGVPSRYAPVAEPDEVAVVEGYAQIDSAYGRIRMGLIPITFGLEGGDIERQLRLPRSLMFQSRFLNLRDLGVSYRIAVNGFFSEWAVHNGEGGTERDHETWFTGNWGWESGRAFRFGISGTAGRTNPKSTDPGGASAFTEMGFRIGEPSRLRVANVFLDWAPNPLRFSMEATAGDTFQGDDVMKFRAAHVDIDWRMSESLSLLTRYDVMSPRNDVDDAEITEYTAGLSIRSRYENSVLYILGTKRVQRNVTPDVHTGMVIWRITPLVSSFSSAL